MANVSNAFKKWLINGIAITIPLVVTLMVLMIVFDFVLGILSPFVTAVALVWSNEPRTIIIQLMMLLSLLVIFLLVGLVAEYTPGKHVSHVVDRTMGAIPGVSTIYLTVRRASEILVDDDTHQFQDVKLIEFPHENAYMLGFLTADTPEAIVNSTGAERMQTIMVPLGPNPTTNGFVMHMPTEKIYDVDLTVEEAVQSIATLGVSEDGQSMFE